jgi:hypothetical protein
VTPSTKQQLDKSAKGLKMSILKGGCVCKTETDWDGVEDYETHAIHCDQLNE